MPEQNRESLRFSSSHDPQCSQRRIGTRRSTALRADRHMNVASDLARRTMRGPPCGSSAGSASFSTGVGLSRRNHSASLRRFGSAATRLTPSWPAGSHALAAVPSNALRFFQWPVCITSPRSRAP